MSTALIQKEPSMTKESEVKVQKVLVVDDEKSISELITTSFVWLKSSSRIH
jgi:hypothetical protein